MPHNNSVAATTDIRRYKSGANKIIKLAAGYYPNQSSIDPESTPSIWDA
jgi:hypothetical protein